MIYVIYCKTLAHVIMQTDKSHVLLSASWTPGKSSGVIPVQVQRPETQGR